MEIPTRQYGVVFVENGVQYMMAQNAQILIPQPFSRTRELVEDARKYYNWRNKLFHIKGENDPIEFYEYVNQVCWISKPLIKMKCDWLSLHQKVQWLLYNSLETNEITFELTARKFLVNRYEFANIELGL
ncbi:MAG: hypothetical protein WCO06_03740 [Candidatus Roizmanbacteria bacterium]